MTARAVVRGAAILLLFSLQAAAGIVLQYNLNSLGGDEYQYVYSIHNDGSLPGSAAIQLFDIYFDPSESSLYSYTTPPPLSSEWSQQFLSPINPGVMTAYDVMATAGGIAAGGTASGFVVDFQWSGTGNPGLQNFEIYSAGRYTLLQSGQTVLSEQQIPVGTPEPSAAIILIGIGTIVASKLRLKRV